MTPIVEAHGLVKRFGKTTALDHLNLEIPSGQIVALLGPNGAGKTTFVRMIATLLRPDEGTLRVGGFDAVGAGARVRSLIGFAGQNAALEPTMTGRENIEMIARMYGLGARRAKQDSAALLEQLGLAEAADRAVKGYSGGMQRKLDLGASLVGDPQLLLLDEPTTGLDPGSRFDLWNAILALGARGTDILLTTQYLEEADQLASRIVIVDHGQVIADGSPAELKSQAGKDVVEVHPRRVQDVERVLEALAHVAAGPARVDRAVSRISVPVDGGSADLVSATRALEERAIDVADIGLRRPTLDEVFLTLTGKEIGNGLRTDHEAA